MAATDTRSAGRDSAIGVPTPRRDSEPKVRGTTKYAGDLAVPGLLHARLLLSHDAHAMISSINVTAARTQNRDDLAFMRFTFEVTNLAHLKRAFAVVRQLKGVIRVARG